MIERDQLVQTLDQILQPERFKDYGPNGLQVEGRREIRKLVSGVTASYALLKAAIQANADAVLVHHGLMWRGQDGRITGWMRQRVGLLLRHDVNLLAYHLPLDAHPEWGNNVQLGHQLGLVAQSVFGEQGLGVLGVARDREFANAAVLAEHIASQLGRTTTLVQGGTGAVRRIAWCTGGAQSYFEAAIAAGADVFITGEISEPQAHYARECGVSYIACGHHASERYGAPALAAHVAQTLGIAHEFIDIDNPA